MLRRAVSIMAITACLSGVAEPVLVQSRAYADPAPALAALPKPQPPSIPDKPPVIEDEAPDMTVSQSIGCVVAGGLGTTVAMAAGAENLIGILAGGAVAPLNQVALYTAIVGVVFSTFCAVGQAVTPLYLHATRPAPSAHRQKVIAENSCSAPQGSSAMRPDIKDLLQPVSLASTPQSVSTRAAEGPDMSTPDMFRRKR